jgi:hypothetical protein
VRASNVDICRTTVCIAYFTAGSAVVDCVVLLSVGYCAKYIPLFSRLAVLVMASWWKWRCENSVTLLIKMSVRRGASCACYVGVFYCLYFINIGNTQLLINVKNQVNYIWIISICSVYVRLTYSVRLSYEIVNIRKKSRVYVALNEWQQLM